MCRNLHRPRQREIFLWLSQCRKWAHFDDSNENGLIYQTFRNLHGLRQRRIFLRLSLCGKRATFYWLKSEWLKIPNVQKFTQTQTKENIPLSESVWGNGTHFTDTQEHGLKFLTCRNLNGLRQREICHCRSLCEKLDTFCWLGRECLKIPDVQKFTRT